MGKFLVVRFCFCVCKTQRNNAGMEVCVCAGMPMNNVRAVGVFIFNTKKMFACEARGTLRGS